MRKLWKRKVNAETLSLIFRTAGATLVFIALIFFGDMCLSNISGFNLNEKTFLGLAGNNDIAILIGTVSLLVLGVQILYEREYFLFSLITAGALSNIAQRILYGGVADYIQIWRWPPFNIADVAIVLALILIVIRLISKKHSV